MTVRRLNNTALQWKNKKIILISTIFPFLFVLFYYFRDKIPFTISALYCTHSLQRQMEFKRSCHQKGWDGRRGRSFIKPLKRFLTHFASENNKSHKTQAKELSLRLSRSKLRHPFFIFLQVCRRNRFGDFLQSQLKVPLGNRHLKLLFRKRTNLLGS